MPAALVPRSGWTGLLLAGGQSKRMGRDKADLLSSNDTGQTLFEDALDKLRSCCGQGIVLGGAQGPPGQDPNLFFLADAERGAGPLPALADALLALTTEWCLVLPLDMPGIQIELLVAGMDRIDEGDARVHSGMFAADRQNRGCFPFWLHRSAGPSLRSTLAGGERSLFRALVQGGALSWNPPENLAPMDRDPFRNLNTPEDHEAWQQSFVSQGEDSRA